MRIAGRRSGSPTISVSTILSVDRYLADTVSGAKLVIVRLLGGSGYWSYGVQELRALAESGGPPVAFLAGDGKPDPELDYCRPSRPSTAIVLRPILMRVGRRTHPPFFRCCMI